MEEFTVIIIAIVIFFIGFGFGGVDAAASVKRDLIADCAVTGSFRIDKDAYKCVKTTRATDEPKH